MRAYFEMLTFGESCLPLQTRGKDRLVEYIACAAQTPPF
jgi:hypothetical protein